MKLQSSCQLGTQSWKTWWEPKDLLLCSLTRHLTGGFFSSPRGLSIGLPSTWLSPGGWSQRESTQDRAEVFYNSSRKCHTIHWSHKPAPVQSGRGVHRMWMPGGGGNWRPLGPTCTPYEACKQCLAHNSSSTNIMVVIRYPRHTGMEVNSHG